ncbi:XRE family transcriptional regulator of biofilm formation [Neobacillus niacini]|uniref:helix-turn-helix domain-containing protein n=1 Tax=Neobacillus driksii TaxID=3035913 RepID=UPI0027854147|nr:helix-turn-helix transcriptional regulator [Neobacillus niacini]MDQ0975372.1 XRE family transcriptional regulator of biofilm formation [Neobacillus niacini]
MIGKNIYEIRMKKGLTLSALAERANISKSYLSNIERNLNQNPSIHVIGKIANELGVDIKELLKSVETKDQQSNDNEWLEIVNELRETGIEKGQLNEYKTLIEFIKWQNQNTEAKK